MLYKNLFTSESVGKGHPDKICDQISDAILDEALKIDKNSRVAIEVMAANKNIIIGGEINTNATLNYVEIAKKILKNVGIDINNFNYYNFVNKQSSEISKKINIPNDEIGAGDQGIKFGYACDETKNYMPLPIELAHKIVERVEQLRFEYDFIKSDTKSQVTIDYTNPRPKIHNIVLSVQHSPNIELDELRNFLFENVILSIVKQYGLNDDFKTYINSGGAFTIGGPIGDTGLTGRKIIVDTYGGIGRHGGGGFSGKDYTKVDRSGAYTARWIAKNLVAANVAKKVEIQLAYVIGRSLPTAISIETFNTSKISNEKLITLIYELFDLTPNGMKKSLNLDQPFYLKTASFGHFGNPEYPWEKLNKVEEIKKYLELNK